MRSGSFAFRACCSWPRWGAFSRLSRRAACGACLHRTPSSLSSSSAWGRPATALSRW